MILEGIYSNLQVKWSNGQANCAKLRMCRLSIKWKMFLLSSTNNARLTNWQIVKLDHIVSHEFFKRTDIKIWNIVRIELIWSVKSKRTTYWCVVCRRERYFNVMALYRGLYMHNSMPYGNNFVILIFGMSGILIFTFVNCFLFSVTKYRLLSHVNVIPAFYVYL